MRATVKRNGEVFFDDRLIEHVVKCDGFWVRSYYFRAREICLGGLQRLRSKAVEETVAIYVRNKGV